MGAVAGRLLRNEERARPSAGRTEPELPLSEPAPAAPRRLEPETQATEPPVGPRRAVPEENMQATAEENARAAGAPYIRNEPETPVTRPETSPNYSVWTEAELAPGTYTRSDANHFRQANRQLWERMQADPEFAAALEEAYPGVTAHVTPGPRGGMADTSPPGLTWHHVPDSPGRLQLVPRDQHQAPGAVQDSLHPGGEGGRNIWGGGR